MKSNPLSQIELRVRQKASYDHMVTVREKIKELTKGCYYSGGRNGNTVPRLTLRTEVKNEEDGTILIVNRAPTIQEVGDLLARAISDFEQDAVEAKAVNDVIEKLQKS